MNSYDGTDDYDGSRDTIDIDAGDSEPVNELFVATGCLFWTLVVIAVVGVAWYFIQRNYSGDERYTLPAKKELVK